MNDGADGDDTDLDECRVMPDACPHGRCINTMGSYRCLCDSGYQVDSSGVGCTDVDECATDDGPCSHVCRNTPGSFVCSCPPGYRLGSDERTCRDVDECSTDRHGCPHACANLPGGFECRCLDGYRMVDSTCVGKQRWIGRENNFRVAFSLQFRSSPMSDAPKFTQTAGPTVNFFVFR